MAQTYIERWADPALEPDFEWTPVNEQIAQLLRLENDYRVVEYCKGMKRRLGQDASREELAVDKKIARRALARLRQSYINQGGNAAHLEQTKFTEEQKRQGAQMDWDTWWLNHVYEMREALRRIATNGKATSHIQATNKLLARIEWELHQLSDVFGVPEEVLQNQS